MSEIKDELMAKLIEADKWYNEQMRKNKPAIIVSSQGFYIGSYGTASFSDYVEAVKEGRIEIHNKKYKDKISKIIKNDIEQK